MQHALERASFTLVLLLMLISANTSPLPTVDAPGYAANLRDGAHVPPSSENEEYWLRVRRLAQDQNLHTVGNSGKTSEQRAAVQEAVQLALPQTAKQKQRKGSGHFSHNTSLVSTHAAVHSSSNEHIPLQVFYFYMGPQHIESKVKEFWASGPTQKNVPPGERIIILQSNNDLAVLMGRNLNAYTFRAGVLLQGQNLSSLILKT
jgi:hypothetical protein